MTGLLGASALQVMLGIAILGAVLAALGARRSQPALVRAAYGAVYTHAALALVATGAMIVALVTHDFSVSYVAQVGSRATPLFYTIISLWGALEGSILFWALTLALVIAFVAYRYRDRAGTMMPFAISTLLATAAFFDLLLVGPARPFGAMSPIPTDGPGPNPLLQNHLLMGVHPPLLYIGFVLCTVPFAIAVGAALAGELETDDWIALARRWTIPAWGFLSAAIIAGMWWSYEVLGWGGYWAWDPVENASLMPWLTATAFLHAAILQQRRGGMRLWGMLLVVSTFTLTILGTFLTRSGILSSVHAFTQGTIGYYFLGFIVLVLVGALLLIAGTADKLRTPGTLDGIVSRETALLLGNLLLATVTFTVLLGTLFPLVAEAVRGVKLSVGAPFFNRMVLPLCAAVLFLMGVGPALAWRQTTRERLRVRLLPALGAAVAGALLAAVLGARDPFALLVFAFSGFTLGITVAEMVRMTWQSRRQPVAGEQRPAASIVHRMAGHLAHLGMLSVAVGIAASSTMQRQNEATLRVGERMQVGAVALELDELWGQEQAHRFVVGASLSVWRDGRQLGTITPRQNFYASRSEPVPTPAVRSRAGSDLYVNLMAFTPDGSSATVRALTEPLVMWIWGGGGLLVLGAAVALWPRRRAKPPAVIVPAVGFERVARPMSVTVMEPLVAHARVTEVTS